MELYGEDLEQLFEDFVDFKCLMMPGLDAHIRTSLCGQVNFKTLQKGLDLSSIVYLIPPNI